MSTPVISTPSRLIPKMAVLLRVFVHTPLQEETEREIETKERGAHQHQHVNISDFNALSFRPLKGKSKY
jgi:hypothetical protein